MNNINGFYSFFFSSDDEILCQYEEKIISILYEQAKYCSIESCLYKGDLLLISLSSTISKVHTSNEEQIKKPTLGYSLSINKDLLKSLSWELYDSLHEKYCNFKEYFHPIHFATKDIYVISVSNLSEDNSKLIDNKMSIYSNYFGMAECDLKNPMHYELFVNYMFQDYYINDKTLYYKEYYDDPKITYPYWADGKDIKIKAISEFAYNNFIPKIEIPENVSERGEVFLNIYRQEKLNHSSEIASNLLEKYLLTNELNKEFTYNVDEKFTFKNIIIRKSKLTEYALNKEHPDGRHKAKLFEDLLGITSKDWKYLSSQIIEGLLQGKVSGIKITEHGIQYHVDIQILGLNGKTKTVLTAWIVDKDSNACLTTIRVEGSKEQKDQVANDILYIENNFKSKADYYAELYKLAHEKAMISSESKIPTPLFLEECKEPMVACGWADVVIDGRSGLATWLKKNLIGDKHYKKGWIISAPHSISFDKNVAYAETFSKILTINNVPNIIERILD